MAVMEFINKLVNLLKYESHVAKWSDDGTEFQIYDVAEFQNNVLQKYFRHSNLDSFVRQLNMYGFKKISRRKNEMIFYHEYFIKDKPEQYPLIKRRSKIEVIPKQELEMNAQIKEQVQSLHQIQPNFAELMTKIFKSKQTIKKIQPGLKDILDHISKEVSLKKGRIVKPLITEIKECFKDIEHAGKKVDESLLRNTKSREKKKTMGVKNWVNSPKTKFMSTPNMMDYENDEKEGKKRGKQTEGVLSLGQYSSEKSIGGYIN